MKGVRESLTVQALVVVAACAAVYLPLLGSSGFAYTEGHRVIPGWTMARTGEWGRMEMFGAPYYTKPPGMSALIGVSARIFGESELSARLPAALCMTAGALVTLAFARLWFGRRWALAAGLAHALTPWFFSPARSAEIESLHQLGVQLAAFSVLTLVIGRRSGGRARLKELSLVLLGAAGFFVMIMAKGPAGAPAVAGAVVAAAIVRRSVWALADWRLAGVLVLGAAGALALLAQISSPLWTAAAVQAEIGEYLWRREELPGLIALVPAAFVAALPASLALVFPWGPDARLEGRLGPDEPARRAHEFARGLALAWAVAMATYLALGVSNHRYAMPAALFAPPLVAYVLRGVGVVPDGFLPLRRRIARTMLLGRGWGWLALLLVGAAVWIPISEVRRERHSGRAAGERLGEVLSEGARHADSVARLHADSIIETVPETLLYAQRAASQQDRQIRVVWDRRRSWLEFSRQYVEWHYVVRTDGTSDEWGRYRWVTEADFMAPVHSDGIRHVRFTAYSHTAPSYQP